MLISIRYQLKFFLIKSGAVKRRRFRTNFFVFSTKSVLLIFVFLWFDYYITGLFTFGTEVYSERYKI